MLILLYNYAMVQIHHRLTEVTETDGSVISVTAA